MVQNRCKFDIMDTLEGVSLNSTHVDLLKRKMWFSVKIHAMEDRMNSLDSIIGKLSDSEETRAE